MGETKPKQRNIDPVKDAHKLVEGRYGTGEMCNIWGPEATFENVMAVQPPGLKAINNITMPKRIDEKYIIALEKAANLESTRPERIREIEALGGHDVIAIGTAYGEAADLIEPGSSSYINYLRTSADSTETAKAIQCKHAYHVLADSIENLRDITLEKSMEWIEKPYMDQTHLLDAQPTVAGRPLSFFAEMLQSDLDVLKFFHDNSLVCKWADATGNHHAAEAAEIDGMLLQQLYADKLDLNCMTAPAQTPGREYISDIVYSITRAAGTVANLARYIRMGRGMDRGVFYVTSPGKKGSAAMPHKDASGGNPDTEEQAEGFLKILAGDVSSELNSIVFDYGRDLSGSAMDRIILGNSFKLSDDITRKIARIVYKMELNEARSLDRINRTYGIVTSGKLVTYLVDPTKTKNPMARTRAHDLCGDLSIIAYKEKRPYFEVLCENDEITSRIGKSDLREITDPSKYVGFSSQIIEKNYAAYHKKKTFQLPTL
jgi:adenylosuccinate lyase